MSNTPEQVGPYRIVRELGRGGMAVVYLAKQPVLARSVALKELAPFLAGDPALAQRFIREAQVAGSLSHPNVVTVFDFLEQDGVPYIAMEYLERGSLRPFVGRMSVAQVAGVLEGVLAALSHAEAMKIVHRDVKPENLLVTSDGGVKIADFGIAKAMQQVATEEMLTPAGATVGTPAYMAPEQAMAQEIGGWTDLYQTGVVAYELLAGAVPFRSEGSPVAVLMQHITDPAPPLPAGTDPALDTWVRRMMAKEPADRPRDARAAWDELEDIVLAIEGPRWRRDARLGEDEPTAEHQAPLTPARFSTWQNYVPEGSSTPPPPPPPATTPVTPSQDPAYTSGYVEFVRPHERTASETPPGAAPPAPVGSATPAPADPPIAATPDPEAPASAEPPAAVTPDSEPPAAADQPAAAGEAAPEPPAPIDPPAADPEPPASGDPAAPPFAPPTTGFFDHVPPDHASPPREPTPPPVVGQPAERLPAVTPPPRKPTPPPREPTPPPREPTPPPREPTPPPREPTPSPEFAPTLAPTTQLPGAQPPKRRSKALPIGVLGLLAAAVVAFVLISSGGDDTPTPTPTATVTETRTAVQPPAGPFAVGDAPDGIAVGANAVWAVGSGDGTLTRIDPATGKTTKVDVGRNPDSVIVAFDSVWVSVTGEDKVVRLSTTEQPAIQREYAVGDGPEGLAVSPQAIWVANSGDGTLSQIIEATGKVNRVQGAGKQPVDVAVGAGAVWVADAAGSSVVRVDGGLRRVVTTVDVGPNPRAVTIIGRDVWVATAGDGRAWQVDGDANRATGNVRVGGQPRDIATDGERLFVTDREGDRVVEIDPATDAVADEQPVEDGPLSLAPAGQDLWVTQIDGNTVARVSTG